MLDAYVQIANAYRRLDKPQDADNALQQAKLLLARMKPEVPFDETSIYYPQAMEQAGWNSV